VVVVVNEAVLDKVIDVFGRNKDDDGSIASTEEWW